MLGLPKRDQEKVGKATKPAQKIEKCASYCLGLSQRPEIFGEMLLLCAAILSAKSCSIHSNA